VNEESCQRLLDRSDKRIHVALPIRVTYWDRENKPCLELACTYDISARGARVTELRYVKEAGEIIAVERGKSKAFCRVVWVGEPNSELRGQVGIQCIEADRLMFESELRGLEEVYEKIQGENSPYRMNPAPGSLNGNRRRLPRFDVQGVVDLLKRDPSADHTAAILKNLSETGCLVTSNHKLVPGTELKLVLQVGNQDLRFRGRVRRVALDFGVGIEFREIRKGDRQVLQFLLHKLAEKEKEEEEKPKAKAAIVSL
jgi:hypothetical protein